MKIVVGLGNPGIRYAETRHNIGWCAVEKFASKLELAFRRRDDYARIAKTTGLVIAKPITFMNESGLAVASLCSFYKAAPESVLVVYDDMNLPLGMVRVRAHGSSGGHRGIQSIIERLGTDRFPRLRLGIGPKPAEMDNRAFVLSPFAESEDREVRRITEEAADAIGIWVEEGIEKCMNTFNRRIPSEAVMDSDEAEENEQPGAECEPGKS